METNTNFEKKPFLLYIFHKEKKRASATALFTSICTIYLTFYYDIINSYISNKVILRTSRLTATSSAVNNSRFRLLVVGGVNLPQNMLSLSIHKNWKEDPLAPSELNMQQLVQEPHYSELSKSYIMTLGSTGTSD
ncbi:hypothetical protein ACJX0J_011561 [Zea mays]